MNGKANKSEPVSKTAESHQDIAVQSWLAEYQALKNEMLSLARGGDTLIGINILALGIILSVWKLVNFPSETYLLMLAMSFVSSCLGLIWVAGQRHIIKVSNYINNRVAPSIRDISNNTELLKWEEEARRPFKFPNLLADLLTTARRGILTVTFMFFLPSIFTLGLALYRMDIYNLWDPWYFKVLFIVTGILILILSVGGVKWFREWPLEEERNV